VRCLISNLYSRDPKQLGIIKEPFLSGIALLLLSSALCLCLDPSSEHTTAVCSRAEFTACSISDQPGKRQDNWKQTNSNGGMLQFEAVQ